MFAVPDKLGVFKSVSAETERGDAGGCLYNARAVAVPACLDLLWPLRSTSSIDHSLLGLSISGEELKPSEPLDFDVGTESDRLEWQAKYHRPNSNYKHNEHTTVSYNVITSHLEPGEAQALFRAQCHESSERDVISGFVSHKSDVAF